MYIKEEKDNLNLFFLHENIKSLVEPFSAGFPYYRPFILHGDPQQIDLFLIGINPATSVFPENGVDTDKWIETIMDYQLYHEYYSSHGRTRIGIQGFLDYIKKHYPYSLIETNCNAFPTPKAADLSQPFIKSAVSEGEKRFMKVLTSHEPSIIIIHSQHATKHFLDILVKYRWISPRSVLKETPIKEREKQFPHFSFTYPSGKRVYIFSCRHLKLFGYRGNTFKDFLVGLTPYLNIKK